MVGSLLVWRIWEQALFFCASKMKHFAEAGVHFKAFLATWHAWLNNKLGGDLTLIHKAADLFRHSWLALVCTRR